MNPGKPFSLSELLDGVSKAQEAAQRLRQRSVDDLISVLDRIIQRFLDPQDSFRQRAEAELPAATGFSAEMVRHGLPLLLEPLRGREICALLDTELGDRHVLDRSVGRRRAYGPDLIVHVLSGNIPALGAAPLLLSLAIKSPVIVKPAAGDPVFPVLLQEALAQVDASLADCVVVAPWRGGDVEVEEAIFAKAALVIASGSDAAIASIRRRAPARFIGHGHKVSFAAIGRECLEDERSAREQARRLAYDVSLWDQQGCLSPQLCYVEERARISPATFAEMVGSALAIFAKELRPRALSFEERSAVQRFRQEAEWGEGGLLAAATGTEWSVSVERGCHFKPTCLNRCLRVVAIDDLEQLSVELPRHRSFLEAAGLAVGRERFAEAATMLSASGVHRICRLGTMQVPSLEWPQSGRPRVADWIEWSVVEDAST